MHRITAEFSLNTPLFSSGADKTKPELRVSEIKAALRFWWRAMNYALYVSDRTRFVDIECQLFGSANALHGQGVLVSLIADDKPRKKRHAPEVHEEFKNAPGARYLGFGLMEYADSPTADPPKHKAQLSRACIDPGWSFTIRLVWKTEATRAGVHKKKILPDAEFEFHLLQTLRCFGLFGGLGSRSRRGFGSVTLVKLEVRGASQWTLPADTAALGKAIQTILVGQRQFAPATPEYYEYSAFTLHSRGTVLAIKNAVETTPYQLLDAMGSAFVRYRAWGRFGKILNNEDANQIFKDDHNWFRTGPIRTGFQHPDRVVFGLPYPYSQNVIWGGKDVRRASPLFFHVHKASPKLHLGLMFDLRSQFLALGTTLTNPKSPLTQVAVTPDWAMIDELLEGAIPSSRSGKAAPISLIDGIVRTRIF